MELVGHARDASGPCLVSDLLAEGPETLLTARPASSEVIRRAAWIIVRVVIDKLSFPDVHCSLLAAGRRGDTSELPNAASRITTMLA